MRERITFAILALLALIVVAALVLAWISGDYLPDAGQLLRDIAIGLVGALGGWSAHRAASGPTDGGAG